MSQSATITIRTNPSVKEKAQKFFDESGITLSTAINLFLSDVVSNQHVSFSFGKVLFHEVEYENLPKEVKKSYQEVKQLDENDFVCYDLKNGNP